MFMRDQPMACKFHAASKEYISAFVTNELYIKILYVEIM
jgi:hypothetical protein